MEIHFSKPQPPSNFKATRQQLENCALRTWYPQFQLVTFETLFIQLPEHFIEYLKEDKFVVPPSMWPARPDPYDRFDCGEEPWSDEETEDEIHAANLPFSEILEKLKTALDTLGGAALCKLNWSCPKDATIFNSSGSLKCTTAEDVIFMLKSSDIIANEIVMTLELQENGTNRQIYSLALRKWVTIREAFEFRCFVKDHKLIGISQRHASSFYHVLESNREHLQHLIYVFFKKHIQMKFPDSNYTFDVYVAKNDRVYLIDFNPWAAITEPLLFSWEELLNWAPNSPSSSDGKDDEEQLIDFRIISSPGGIRPSIASASRVPFEFVDIASNANSNSLQDLIEQMKGIQQNEQIEEV